MPATRRVLTLTAALAAVAAAATTTKALRAPAWVQPATGPWLPLRDDDLYELLGDEAAPEASATAVAAAAADGAPAAPRRCGAAKPTGGTCQRRVATGHCKSHTD